MRPRLHLPPLTWSVGEVSSLEEGDVAQQLTRFSALRQDKENLPLQHLGEAPTLVVREFARAALYAKGFLLVMQSENLAASTEPDRLRDQKRDDDLKMERLAHELSGEKSKSQATLERFQKEASYLFLPLRSRLYILTRFLRAL